jgi:hypothetical protein
VATISPVSNHPEASHKLHHLSHEQIHRVLLRNYLVDVDSLLFPPFPPWSVQKAQVLLVI